VTPHSTRWVILRLAGETRQRESQSGPEDKMIGFRPAAPQRDRQRRPTSWRLRGRVEGFDRLREVHHDDRCLRVFLGQIVLVLHLQVDAPLDRELEFLVRPFEHPGSPRRNPYARIPSRRSPGVSRPAASRCAGRRRRGPPLFRSVVPRRCISAMLLPIPHCSRGRQRWFPALASEIGDVHRAVLAVAGLPPVFTDSLSTGASTVDPTFLLFPTFLRRK
jgi:hypothetical protein